MSPQPLRGGVATPAARGATPTAHAASGVYRAARKRAVTGTYTVFSYVGSTAAMAAVSADDIRDIRGPKYLRPVWLLPALLAGVAALALAAFALRRWLRRSRRPAMLSPSEIALQRLQTLRAQMQPAQARKFSIALSDIVRNYIEVQFRVTATKSTTEEFLQDLLSSANAALTRHRPLLAEFLQQCDLVKFAGVSLSLASMEALHHSARAFVLATANPAAAPASMPETRAA